ncbi:toll/interleukin-1 receptor domain-containing protein, partial [Frankia sp. CiP3]|uniref:toll/interleukin-1 receptor domain-containing protein n=1 Tax=Frankia sp. CiP3 TaxID=2880971 RepID=UPI001EF43E40
MGYGDAVDGWDFFVSYTQSDRAWAEWIAWVLEEDGFRVLIQAWDFGPGTNWVVGMQSGVSRATRTIAVLSDDYARSVYETAEWQAAWVADPAGQDRKLLVARVAACDRPGLLRQVVGVDLMGIGEDAARMILREAARVAVFGGRAKPASAPPFPPGLRAIPRPVAFPGGPSPAVVSRLRPPEELLPELPSRFVPRDSDVAGVRALLTGRSTGPVVGIVGMGGAGKSTLARALVHDDGVRAAFPDGIVWVEVTPRPDLAALQTQVLAAFGFPEPVVDVRVGTARLREVLAGAVCLIVADNVWDREVLAGLPVPAGSRLLVTTRDREVLFADNKDYRLEQVNNEMARRVLARYAGCEVTGLPEEADEIVRRCGGLVLALAVMGGMVAEGRRWAVVTARLRRADLAWFVGRLSDYPQGLLAALDASVAALGEPDADRFRELVVFEGRGPVPVAVAVLLWQATSGLDELDAEDLLSRLGRHSLVQIDPASDTFTLHDLLFDYARATLLAEQREQVHGVLARCFLSRWGGLDTALPALGGRLGFDAVDRYGMSALIVHLLAAGEPETVDALLAAERPTCDGRAESVWYVAHESQGSTGDYLADVRAAWQDARTRHPADDPRGLGRQVGYALLFGSITSLAANIPPPLLVRLVEAGLWPPARALAYAQAIPDPAGRAEAVAGLASHLPPDQRGPVLAQALSAAITIDWPEARVRALVRLAPHLPPDQHGLALAQAL